VVIIEYMNKTIETLKYMGVLLLIGVIFSLAAYGLEQVIGKVGVLISVLVLIFFLIRAKIT